MHSDRSEARRALGQRYLPRNTYDIPAVSYANPGPLAPGYFTEPEPATKVAFGPILRRNRRVILATMSVAILGAVVYTALATPLYRARTLVELQGSNENFMHMKDLDPNATSTYSVDRAMETQTALLTSESLLERTAKKLQLGERTDVFRKPSLLERVGVRTPAPSEPVPADRLVGPLHQAIKVKPEGQSSLISVTVDLPSAKMAAEVANTLTSEFIEQSQESRWDNAVQTGERLTRQLEDFRTKLQRSEKELQDYARNNDLLFTGDQNNVAEDKLRQVQQELSRTQADRAEKQSQLELIASSPSDSVPRVLDDGSLREYKSKLTELRRQLAELSSSLTPAHYKVKRVQAQIAELESTLERERGNIINRIRNDYQAALRREKLVGVEYGKQAKLVSEQSVKAIKYNMLKHDIDTNRELYQSMLQKVKEASIVSALKASNLRVIDPAKVPFAPYKPDLAMNLALGLISGGLCSMLIVLLKERNSRVLRTPGETAESLNVRELAVIPSARVDPGHRRFPAPLRNLLGPGSGVDSATESQLELVTWSRKQSLMAESFRTALTSFLRTNLEGVRPRVVMITSSSPNSGKTLSVTNLGIAFAEINQKVLLIDGDLRRPRLHEIFSISNTNGFSDLLAEEGPIDSARLNSSIRRSFISGLHVLPSGSRTSDIAQLFYKPRMADLFTRFRADFDWVLIDAPPVLTLFDARVLGLMTDGVILVCRAGHTSQEQLVAAWKDLADDGIPVLGTILNDWNPQGSDPAYYGAYSQYYRGTQSRDPEQGS